MTSPSVDDSVHSRFVMQERPLGSSLEVVLDPLQRGERSARWLAAPGTVSRFESQTVAMHFAPARWLLADAAPKSVVDAQAEGAIVFEVTGKWRCLEIGGAGAADWLAAGTNLAMVLHDRDCAAVSLFDCPVVIARRSDGDGFDLYVVASYWISLCAALDRARLSNAPE